MKTKWYLPLLASLVFLLPSLISAASLVSCVSCSNVTCPTGTICGNIGSCPNGAIKWGCKYPSNGMPVATSLNATLSVNTTTIATTVPAPATTTPSAPSAPVSPFGLEWLAAFVVIIVVIILVYYFAVAKRISKQQPPAN